MVQTYLITGRFGKETFTKVGDARWRAARRRKSRLPTREKCPFCSTLVVRRSPTMIEDHFCMRAYRSALSRYIANLQAQLTMPEE